jgi:hypothetical protein
LGCEIEGSAEGWGDLSTAGGREVDVGGVDVGEGDEEVVVLGDESDDLGFVVGLGEHFCE